MKTNGKQSVTERMRDNAAIQRAMRAGVQQALRVHKLLGVPIAEDRGGKVVVVPPEEIQLGEAVDGRPSLPDSMTK
jgi:hypothetical protein